jgi:transaldolase
MTSNPTIFEKAIVGSDDYDEALLPLVEEGLALLAIYETLAMDDIRRAADLLRPVHNASNGADGYVSLEANPHLAHDTEGTLAEVRRLFNALDRPNVMIKVPATPEGIPAVETLIGEGINVNVTLIFAVDQYKDVALAYLSGLEKLIEAGGDPGEIASVASFFVSRIDTAVDRELEEIGDRELRGKIATASAKTAYASFQKIFAGERWERLAAQGVRVQRLLWGSTSTKNPDYSDTRYVDNLIGPHTVNTVPPVTLNAFRDHGTVALTLEHGANHARVQLARLAELGIDLDAITGKLLQDGVAAFAQSFDSLLSSIEDKGQRLRSA